MEYKIVKDDAHAHRAMNILLQRCPELDGLLRRRFEQWERTFHTMSGRRLDSEYTTMVAVNDIEAADKLFAVLLLLGCYVSPDRKAYSVRNGVQHSPVFDGARLVVEEYLGLTNRGRHFIIL